MCDTCETLGAALEDGRIGAVEVGAWRRAFEAEPNAARGLLEGRQPDQRRRIANRVATLNARPADLTDDVVRAHELELARSLFVDVEDLI